MTPEGLQAVVLALGAAWAVRLWLRSKSAVFFCLAVYLALPALQLAAQARDLEISQVGKWITVLVCAFITGAMVVYTLAEERKHSRAHITRILREEWKIRDATLKARVQAGVPVALRSARWLDEPTSAA